MNAFVPQYLWGIGSRTPSDTKIHGCSSPLYKMAHLHITYAHPLLYFKSSLHYLRQCKCYVNSCQRMTNSSCIFWNFLEFFFSNIFYPWLVESMNSEPEDMKEDRL